MYYPLKDKFIIENIVDYNSTQVIENQINIFLEMLDDEQNNIPILTDTVEDLQSIADRMYSARKLYDKKRLTKTKLKCHQ